MISIDTKLVILFGSSATGTAGSHSDADVAVLADHILSLRELGEISHDIAEELHVSEDKIDIVDLSRASPLLQYEIATQGKLLHGDNADFVRFKVLAWKRYMDTAKLRRIRAQSLTQYVQRSHSQKT